MHCTTVLICWNDFVTCNLSATLMSYRVVFLSNTKIVYILLTIKLILQRWTLCVCERERERERECMCVCLWTCRCIWLCMSEMCMCTCLCHSYVCLPACVELVTICFLISNNRTLFTTAYKMLPTFTKCLTQINQHMNRDTGDKLSCIRIPWL